MTFSRLAIAVCVLVTTAAVLYSGATTLETVFGIPLVNGVVLIAALAVAYSTWGGLLSLDSERAPTASDSGTLSGLRASR